MKLNIETNYWTPVKNEVLENRVLSLAAKLLLSHLSRFQKYKELIVWVRNISNRYGITDQEVMDAFDELERNGLVKFTPVKGETKKYVYEFLPNVKKWFNGLLY